MDGEDFTAWAEYYRKARICPHCGNDEKVAESEHPFGGVRMRRYVCLKCGWNWEVEAYHEENEGAEAAEEKFASRPQILKGDIVRFIAGETGKQVVEVVTCEIEEGASYTPAFSFNPFFNEVLAIYRFDGRDFKCIWESVEYQFNRFKEIIDGINNMQLTLSVKLKSVNEAMEKLRKEAGDSSHGSEEAN